jgi:predicted NUDIX family phosphoesterase/thymidylate kinase
MTKSAHQTRAESLVGRFRASLREPLVVEFSGSPKAGKTTVLNAVAAFLKRCGYKVDVVVERASVCPIRDKRHFHFNVWTACSSLTQMLERTQAAWKPDDPQIVILDRGVFDSICWMRLMTKLSRLSDANRAILENFLLLEEWRRRLAGVVVMTANPNDSMEREKGHLPVLMSDGKPVTGSIMNEDILKLYANVVANTAEELKASFPIFTLDTSESPYLNEVKGTCEAVADIILNQIELRLEEKILALPRHALPLVTESSERWLDHQSAREIVDRYEKTQNFGPRSQVEADSDLIQAIPVAVIRDGSGKVLRLKRRERDVTNSLHEQMVIWAGGHCHEQDLGDGGPILRCLVRELDEELRLQVKPDQFKLLGAIYAPGITKKGAQHLAIVYEWTAPSTDVAIVLNAEEFLERRGNSQSGRFADMETIVRDLREASGPTQKRSRGPTGIEPWTLEILRNHFLVKVDLHDSGHTGDMFNE